jgi:uncharacterized protein with LGFP repeats
VRRLIVGSLAFLAMTGTVLTLPVYAAPVPDAHPVETSIDEVQLGSVVEPATDAVVATDGVVQQDGVEESEATGTSVPVTTPDPSVPATTADPSVPVTTADPSVAPAPEASTSASETPASTTGPSSSSTSPSTSTAPEEDVPTSGDEIPGVPALTISRDQTDPFSSVGVTWREDAAITDVQVQIRVRAEDGDWGEWTTLEADDIEQTATAETEDNDVRGGTAPYWTGPAEGIEVIVQGAGGAVPEDVSLALLDPGTSDADLLPTSGATDEAHAGTSMPDIISRGQWGADESIRGWDPEYASTIKAATIHHTADGNNYSAAQVPAMMRSIYAYHAQTRGWGDIGYNVIVDKYGRIFEGRYGGLSSTVIGAHAGGFNTGTFGVSMLGNYAETDTPQAMLESVASVIAWKLGLYGVDPYGTTQLTSSGGGTSKYAAGQVVTLPTIFAHRDVGSTTCPGQYAYNRMGQIRDMTAVRYGATGGSPVGNAEVLTMTANRLDIGGWTYDTDYPPASIEVGVSVDGGWALQLPANQNRPDVAAYYPSAGAAHGFTGSLTLSPGKHTICVVFVNGGPTGSNTWARCQVVTSTAPVQPSKNPFGNVETVAADGRTLSVGGWVLDPDALSSSVEVHVYVNGTFAQAVTASNRRDDVAAAYPGAGSAHGFGWQQTVNAAGTYQVCVFAINLNSGTANPQLRCAAVTVSPALFAPFGQVDRTVVDGRTARVAGWALDADARTQSLPVHLYVDGRYAQATTADGSRPDVAAAFPGAGAAHGFTAAQDLAPGAHTLCTFALNAGYGGENPILACSQVAVTMRAWEPIGNVDGVSAVGGGQVEVSGWAVDPDAGPSSSPVHLYVDGQFRTAVTAAGPRPDVAALFPAAGGGHGFTTRLTVGSGTHTVCAYGINVGFGQENPMIACRSVTV